VSESASPRAVLERLLPGISAGRWHELHELYAEEAVVEYPFALAGGPEQLAGRETIRRYFDAVARAPLEFRAHLARLSQPPRPGRGARGGPQLTGAAKMALAVRAGGDLQPGVRAESG
jgi:SnoaL-like domain